MRRIEPVFGEDRFRLRDNTENDPSRRETKERAGRRLTPPMKPVIAPVAQWDRSLVF
jgi:hypothetical protein